ncbi:MAG: hypothetical protein AB8I80_15945 [Anaerolineae bacterium]
MDRGCTRIIARALLLLLAGALGLAAFPARAQGGYGGTITFTIPGPDYDQYDHADLSWSYFHESEADCPRDFHFLNRHIDELTLVLDVNLSAGTVSGSITGALREDWEEDTEPAWGEATFTGSIQQGTLELTNAGGQWTGDYASWEFSGEMVADITLTAHYKCGAIQDPWREETRSSQATLAVSGFMVGGEDGGWSVSVVPSLDADPDAYLDLFLSGALDPGFLPLTAGATSADPTPTAAQATSTAVQMTPTAAPSASTPTSLPAQPGQAGPTPTTLVPVCTPPPCAAGEVYYCPGSCPGGCGIECATPTPVVPGAGAPDAGRPDAGPPEDDTAPLTSLLDDLAETISGGEREPPSPGRTVATVGASAALVAAATAARIALTRAPSSGRSATGEGSAPSQDSGVPSASAGAAPQANGLLARRAALSAEVQAALSRVAMLNRRRAQLADLYRRTEAEWNYTRWTGFSDGVINVVDLAVTVLNPSSSIALAGLLSAAKQGAKGRMRDVVGAAYGVPSRGGADATDSLLSGLGLPTGMASPGGALKQYMINRSTAQSRAAARRALSLNRAHSYDAMRRASRSGSVAQGLGQGLNVVESSASLVSDFTDSSRRMAALRQRMMRVYDQQLAVERALDTARMDVQVARSAYQANEAAIQQLKAQFPHRFAHL